MIDRDYYPLKQATEILNCHESDLTYLGSIGELPIHVLTNHFFVIRQRFDVMELLKSDMLENPLQPIDEELIFSNQPLRLSSDCLRNYESEGLAAKLELASITVFDDKTDRPSERHYFKLEHRHKRSAPTIQDCALVIMHDDLKRLQESKRISDPDKSSSTAYDMEYDDLSENAADAQAVATIDTQPKKKNTRKPRRKTQINTFLIDICESQDIDKLSAETLVRAINPLIGKVNCPAIKYHGFYEDVCVDWRPGTGSRVGSWGKKSFQNFVSKFKKDNS